LGLVADLGDGRDVQGGVQLPVAVPRQTMLFDVA
jgi:hypothetical protein